MLQKYIQKDLRKPIKSLLMIFFMMELGFLFEKKILAWLKQKAIFPLICVVTKTNWLFQFTFHTKNFKNSMDLLLVIDENKSHYLYIKDFDRFMFHKTKNKNKQYFYESCLQCFSSKNVLTEHQKVCLSINGAQSVRFAKRNNWV